MSNREETITSRSNPWLKQLRHAVSRGVLTAGGSALAESPHLLNEALRSGILIERVFTSEQMQSQVASWLPPHRRIPLHTVANRLFDEVATTTRNQGILTLVQLPDWNPATVLSGLTIVLDAVQDPGNAGSIVRSSEAFGASGVVFLKGSVSPTNPKTLRASAGSLFRLPFLHGVDSPHFLELAMQQGKSILAADSRGGTPLSEADLSPDAAVVIGSETHGVAPRIFEAATPIAIPTKTVESLNAAAAATVILYESARRSLRP